MFAPLQYEFFVRGLIVATLVGGLCGLIGVYIVLRRMSYIGHGLSHAIFGGAVTSYVLSINFFVGASMWGFISALLINLTTKKRGINADAAIGIVTTASFALGVALISKFKSFTRSFDAALFGNILGITETDLLAIIIVTIIAIVLIFVGYKYLLFTTFQSDVAGLYGVPTAWVDAAFALLLAAIIVVSLQVLGVTMLAAAIVIPPVTAQLLTNNFHKMLIFSVIIGSLCGLGGLYISFYIDVSSGASVVLFSAIVFVFFLSFTTFQRKVVMRGKRQHEHRSGPSHEIH